MVTGYISGSSRNTLRVVGGLEIWYKFETLYTTERNCRNTHSDYSKMSTLIPFLLFAFFRPLSISQSIRIPFQLPAIVTNRTQEAETRAQMCRNLGKVISMKMYPVLLSDSYLRKDPNIQIQANT